MYRLILNLVFMCFLSFITYAEDVIVLKSGKVVEGKILERTDEYVKIDFHGVELKYYKEQIESVNKEMFKDTLQKDKIHSPYSSLSDIKIFTDDTLGYSFQYPNTWRLMFSDEVKSIMLCGIKPKEDSYITIQLQGGKFSTSETEGKFTLADLLETNLKTNPELKREFIKPITLHYESGYLIRYVYRTNQTIYNAKGVDGFLYLPVKVIFDYYFFSPVFSSQGKDKRVFLIELMYVEFEEIFPQIDSIKNRNKAYELNLYYKDRNKKIKDRYWEAQEIINTFRFSQTH